MANSALDSVKSAFDAFKFTAQVGPSSPDEIAAAEKALQITFPPAYRDFLLWMGARRAGILLGSDWMLDDLPSLKPKLLKTLAENNFPEKLSDDAFVFWGNQGEQFTFVRLSQGDASPVYRYHTTLEMAEKNFRQINNNFPEWLLQQINDHVTRMRNLGKAY